MRQFARRFQEKSPLGPPIASLKKDRKNESFQKIEKVENSLPDWPKELI